MIEGLKFDVGSEELSKHLAERMCHHEDRMAFYQKQADALECGRAEGTGYTNGDPVQSLRSKHAEHENKRDLFKFLHNHLIPGETYRLEEDDLRRLEFVKGNRW